LRSEILGCMQHTLALMDLMMIRVDRNMLSYLTYIRHPVIRTHHLLCLTVINKLTTSTVQYWTDMKLVWKIVDISGLWIFRNKLW